MILPKYSHIKTIEIWNPRWHDRMVLINESHLDKKIPHYRIVFTKVKSMTGNYYLSYKTIKKGKKEMHDGGVIRRAVPMSKLEDLIIEEHSLLEIL